MKIVDTIGEFWKFFPTSLREFHYTGAVCPTSRWAAKAMTYPLREINAQSRKILELGPGTGSVTVKILADMNDRDELTICEINPRLMNTLKRILRENENFIRHKDRVRFFCCPAQNLPEDRKYDVVVCALPFLNFDVHTVRQIFTKLSSLSTENTLMTNYEYIGLRQLGKFVSKKERRRRIYRIDRFFKKFAPNLVSTRKVWLNVLPIHIYTRKLAA